LPRRGRLRGISEWLQSGFGLTSGENVSTPPLEDLSQIVFPWDPARDGMVFARTWDAALTVPSTRHALIMIIGGRNGTYVTAVLNNTTSGVTSVLGAFERNRADVITRFSTYTQLAVAVHTSAGNPEKPAPTTIFEQGHIQNTDRAALADDGIFSWEFGGTLQMFPLLIHSQGIYLPPGTVWWQTLDATAAADFNLGFIFREP